MRLHQWPFSISVAIRSVPLAAFQARCAAPGRPEQALCPQPCPGSRKAEEAAAARNSDFAGCRGNRAAELGARQEQVWAGVYRRLVWAWRSLEDVRLTRVEPRLFR